MGSPDNTSHLRLGVRLFLVLIALNAVLAIGIVLFGSFDDTGMQVLGTSLVLTLGVMLGLGCLAGQDAPRLGPAWLVGLAASAIGTALWVAGIWGELDDEIWQLGASFFAGAAAIAMASLLSRADLPERFRWCLLAADAVLALLLAMVLIAIWSDTGGIFWRFFAVLAIILAALAIAIPVLHTAHRREIRMPDNGSSSFRFCPGCGRRHVAGSATPTTCEHCGTKYTVDHAPQGPPG